MWMENSHQTAVLDRSDVLPKKGDVWNDLPWMAGRHSVNMYLRHLEVNAHHRHVVAAAALRNLRQESMEFLDRWWETFLNPHRWDYC